MYFRNVFKITNYLQTHDVAHNVIITRGESFTDKAVQTVRAYVFPRLSVYGRKNDT